MIFFWITMTLLVHASVQKEAYISWDPLSGKFSIHDNPIKNVAAHANFADEIFRNGWSFLEITTNPQFPDSVQAYSAGLAEGYLTGYLLKNHLHNLVSDYCEDDEAFCNRAKDFLETNFDYLNENIARKRGNDPYWHQAALVVEQLSGLEDGYARVPRQPRTRLNFTDLLILNVNGDLFDLEAVLDKKHRSIALGTGSCSVLLKLLPNNKDLYFSHVTWNTLNTMLRIQKKYNIRVHTGMQRGSHIIPGSHMVFSSYPGSVTSLDDFYLISTGLAVTETTIDNYNETLWKLVQPNGSVLEWIRSTVANRMARSGREWAEIFSRFNSGTYNNQWTILDYKRFQPLLPLQRDLLWVVEQMPGYVHSEDLTYVLRNQSYWPSYNTPYFRDIFTMSARDEKIQKHGDWFTYDKHPRALIFKRDQRGVRDVKSMMKLMRYNDYTRDPFSRCNCTPPYSATNGISARSDLNRPNGTYPFGALEHRPYGGLDVKLTTKSMFYLPEFIAISGPTYDPLPPFSWSNSDFDKTVLHEGLPDVWVFPPVIRKWLLNITRYVDLERN